MHWRRDGGSGAPSPSDRAGQARPVPCGSREEEGREGICDGFTGREKAPVRPSRSTPAMTTTQLRPQHPAQTGSSCPRPMSARPRLRPPRMPSSKASIRAEGSSRTWSSTRCRSTAKASTKSIAGGRRLKALQELAAEGVIAADHQGAVPGQEARGRARNLADGKHDPRRDAPGGRIRRHGGARSTPARRSRRSPPASAPPNGMSGSACASASSRPNCSTPSAPAPSASRS